MELPINPLYNVFEEYNMTKIINPYRFGGVAPDNNPGKDDLVAYYGFEEQGANVAMDAIGENHGSINGATVDQPSVARGYEFDGFNDIVNLLNYNFSNSFSVSMWVKPDTFGSVLEYHYLLGNNDAYNDNQFTIRIYPSNACLESFCKDASGNQISVNIKTSYSSEVGSWGLVTLVYNHSTKSFYSYFNGTLTDSDTNSSFLGLNITYNTLLGFVSNNTNHRNKYFKGTIDQTLVFDAALTQAQVTELYNSGHGLKYDYFDTALKTDLISCWELDELTGTTATDAHGSNDGTITGCTLGVQGIVSNLEKCYDFDGTSDYVDVGDIGDLGTQYSASCWFKTTTISENNVLIGYKTDNLSIDNNIAIQLDQNNADIRF